MLYPPLDNVWLYENIFTIWKQDYKTSTTYEFYWLTFTYLWFLKVFSLLKIFLHFIHCWGSLKWINFTCCFNFLNVFWQKGQVPWLDVIFERYSFISSASISFKSEIISWFNLLWIAWSSQGSKCTHVYERNDKSIF